MWLVWTSLLAFPVALVLCIWHRRRRRSQDDYARIQLFETADRPCTTDATEHLSFETTLAALTPHARAVASAVAYGDGHDTEDARSDGIVVATPGPVTPAPALPSARGADSGSLGLSTVRTDRGSSWTPLGVDAQDVDAVQAQIRKELNLVDA